MEAKLFIPAAFKSFASFAGRRKVFLKRASFSSFFFYCCGGAPYPKTVFPFIYFSSSFVHGRRRKRDKTGFSSSSSSSSPFLKCCCLCSMCVSWRSGLDGKRRRKSQNICAKSQETLGTGGLKIIHYHSASKTILILYLQTSVACVIPVREVSAVRSFIILNLPSTLELIHSDLLEK